MNVRKLNLSLWTLTATLAASALLAAACAVFAPVDVSIDEAPTARKPPATSQTSPDAQLSLDSFEPIWALNLRRPLSDSTAATNTNNQNTSADGSADGSGAPFVLVGTIGDSLAMVRTASGAVELKAVGEQVSGGKILAIRPLQVDIEIGGTRKTISKPREPGGQ